jgi:hypothetical protein
MIGRWMFLFLFSRCCTQSKWVETVKTSCGESPPKKVCSRSSPFTPLACFGSSHFPWKSVWRTQAPSRAAFFVWSATLSKILTLDNFRKRHVIVINRCYICKKIGKSVDHLLLHCDVASALWSSLFNRFGMSWVMPKQVIDLLACWRSSRRPRSTVVWKMAAICLFWCLWRDRNNSSFKDLESTLEEILSSFYLTLYFWTTAYVHSLCKDQENK